MNNVTAPDLGAGPYGVEHDDATGFYYLTLGGERTGKTFPLGKTAYRAARQLNDKSADPALPPIFLDDAPGIVVGLDLSGSKADPFGEEAPPSSIPKPRKGRVAAPKAAPRVQPKDVTPAVVVEALAPNYGTRDEWLNAFIAAARPIFKAADLELPEKVRASIGWMFRSSNKKTLGQCWHEASSADGTREIWINPMLGNLDSSRIADVLTHELAHTLFGPDEKHGKNFKAAVHKLGLEGKATATIAGPEWLEWAGPILEELGPIPHAALDPALSGVVKKKTYLLKATCKTCEFTFRATAKHLHGKELRCPDFDCGGDVEVEGSEDLGEGDGE